MSKFGFLCCLFTCVIAARLATAKDSVQTLYILHGFVLCCHALQHLDESTWPCFYLVFFSWGQHLSMQAEIWPMMKSNVKCLVARTRDRRLVEGHTVKNEDSGECTGLQKIETVLQYTRLQWLRYICHVGNDILGRFLALKWLPKKSQKKPWRPRRICERTMEETFHSIGLSLELSGDVCC